MPVTAITFRDHTIRTTFSTALTDVSSTPKEAPGSVRHESEGRVYVYCYNAASSATLAFGDAVRLLTTDSRANNSVNANIPNATDIGRTAGDKGFLYNTVGSNLPTAAVNSYQGWYVSRNMATAGADTYRIVSNTTTQINLDRGLDTALANSDQMTVWSPWVVTQTTAVTDELYGLAMGTPTASQWGWIQVRGLHQSAKFLSFATTVSSQVHAAVNAAANCVTPLLAPSATAGTLEAIIMTGNIAATGALNQEIVRLAMSKARAMYVEILDAGSSAIRIPVMLDGRHYGD